MRRPNLSAPTQDWTAWADANYPYDGLPSKGRTGFDLIRSEEDPRMRGEMAWAMARGMPPDVRPPHWGEPDSRLPKEPERDLDSDLNPDNF